MTPLLREAVVRWTALGLSSRRWSPETAFNVRLIMGQFQRQVGDLQITGVRPEHIEDFFAAICQRSSPAWTNYAGTWIRQFFLWALRRGYIRRDPTVDAWPRLRGDRTRPFRTLSREEEARILPHCSPAVRRYVVLQISSGLPAGTLYAAKWEWLTEEGALEIPAEALKGRRPLLLPLPRRALETLGLPGAPGDPLLPGLPPKHDLNRRLRRAARKAGIDATYFTSHQLRRTWVERFAAAGGTREECQVIQDWRKSSVLLDRYWPRVPLARAREIIEKI